MSEHIVIGTRLRRFRKEVIKASIEEVAKEVGISRTTYGKYESGEIKIDVDKLQQLHDVHGLNINWVVLGKGSPIYSEEKPSQTNKIKGKAEMTNFLGDVKDSAVAVNESQAEYNSGGQVISELKSQLENISKERDMFKMLYEKNEELLEFYKKQAPK